MFRYMKGTVKMKKVILYILAVMFILSTNMIVIADSDIDNNYVVNDEVVYDLAHEMDMNNELNNLMVYFFENGYSTEEQRYPDFYAGAYISENRDDLVICVTDDSNEIKEIIRKGTGNHKIKIEKKQYSYNELRAECSKIMENYTTPSVFAKKGNEVPEITAVGLRIKENGLVVRIKDFDQKYVKTTVNGIQSFKNKETLRSVNIEMESLKSNGFNNIRYEDGDYLVDNTAYNPGDMLSQITFTGTIGSRGRATNTTSGVTYEGFWTAGHCVKEGTVYNENLVAIGTCIFSYNNDKVDAAFVTLLNEYDEITDDLADDSWSGAGTINPDHYYLTYPEDGMVYMCGAVSGEQGGKIYSTSYDYVQEKTGKYFYDLLCAAYRSELGDSGAAVYSSDGLASDEFIIAGIHKGNHKDNAALSAISKMYNVVEKWRDDSLTPNWD